MSLGVSGSATADTANKVSTGPVAFGSVSVNGGSSTSSWIWIALSAAGAVIAVLLLRRH